MKKTNIEILDQLIEKGYEQARKNPTTLAIEFKREYYADVEKIRYDRDLSPDGKFRKQQALTKTYSKRLMEVLAEMKAEYKKTAQEAQKLAHTIQTTPHEKPSDDMQVKLFEQELDSLQMAVMLGTSVKSSIQALDAFIGKHGDIPYFAEQIKEKFPTLASTVLGIEATSQNRQALADTLKRVEAKATTPERTKAAEALSFFANADNPQFYLTGTAPHLAFAAIIGTKLADRINEPEKVLEEMQAQEQAE